MKQTEEQTELKGFKINYTYQEKTELGLHKQKTIEEEEIKEEPKKKWISKKKIFMDLKARFKLESMQLMFYANQFEQLYALDNNIRVMKEDLLKNAMSG
mgnify:CR=1 FL=1